MDFLSRTRPIMKESGFTILRDKEIAFAGLGGVGGGAFLALVRCGASRFRLAENGIFDPPDMNRQAAAFGSTMNRHKLEVYMELALSINPDLEMVPYPDGVNADNLGGFLDGADAYVAVIDAEKGEDVKRMTPAMQERYGVPVFTCGAVGFGAIMVNFAPDGMKADEFWTLAMKDDTGGGLLPTSMQRHFCGPAMERIRQGLSSGKVATTAIGGLAANALLANEVLAYFLAGTGLVERSPVFAPNYVALDFMTQRMRVADITRPGEP
ncbi:UBA/THIF-type NAD/FAD binding protein [Pseudodesulfovibrio mercurii]|uniref:UBA/THIF-type NAD/FAD binding protein n=1 Tax=Pseudodesulfovibrio mercurii TaxID=641491 RepID=F0JK84_9BACT|nr:ThiF family adenylyltransferase [Pseudodesulfovibrio mercurii]EGB16333.1 UBA/THIF-type NAD/FAD binding protein [Pseudodesulfovibrio mercurii]